MPKTNIDPVVDAGKDAYKQAVGRRIAERAEQLGFNSSDVARKIGASKSTVHSWFKGEAVPQGEYASKLRRVLRFSFDWMFDGKGSPTAMPDNVADALDATWESTDGHMKTEMVRCPQLATDGQLDKAAAIILPKSALASVSDVRMAGWLRATSRSAADFVLPGDTVVVDSAVRQVSESGAFYAISYVSGVNIHQVFAEVDGSLSVMDASRSSKTTYGNDRLDEIKILGRVAWRAGPL